MPTTSDVLVWLRAPGFSLRITERGTLGVSPASLLTPEEVEAVRTCEAVARMSPAS
jgi:hypothetical protein